MNTLKLAWRGLTRNRRRSITTLLATALGFAAIALFAGYTHNVYGGLSRLAIHGELLGHLTINQRGMRTEGKLHPEKYLLRAQDVARLQTIIQSEPQVKLVTPRLALNGLISNGRASTIFIAEGVDAQAIAKLQEGGLTDEEIRSGLYKDNALKKLDAQHPERMMVSQGLADLLQLKTGSVSALLTNTISGQANALDGQVHGFFNTGNAGSNDKSVLMALPLAQSLYDLEGGADRLTVLLDDVAHTRSVQQRLQAKFQAAGLDMEIKTWQDLSDFYNQVHSMFDMMFSFIFSIVLTVVVMSVANSMSMAVVERTREIGTLRAIGLKQSGVVRLFTTESLLLTLLGCALGLALALAVRYGVNSAHIAYIPPNGAREVPLLVDLDWARVSLTGVMMLLVGTLAAYLPARRAARQPIIDALGHV